MTVFHLIEKTTELSFSSQTYFNRLVEEFAIRLFRVSVVVVSPLELLFS